MDFGPNLVEIVNIESEPEQISILLVIPRHTEFTIKSLIPRTLSKILLHIQNQESLEK